MSRGNRARVATRESDGPRLTRALRRRNFRLFFGGQSISLVGTWITRVATSWLVYRLTGSLLLPRDAGRAVDRVLRHGTCLTAPA